MSSGELDVVSKTPKLEKKHWKINTENKLTQKLSGENHKKGFTWDNTKQLVSPKLSPENIGGPSQPEMSAFQSVNSNNMVDLFSGDFSYNIPLLDVGGYPVNLFYRSGITMEQDASWVGLGWNINPGTITRNLRGLPDDFEGSNDFVTKQTSVKDNVKTGVDIGGGVELYGKTLKLSAGMGVFYNNYQGWGLENSINASINSGSSNMGTLSGSLTISNNSQEGLTIAPSIDYELSKNDMIGKGDNGSLSIGGGLSFNSRSGLRASMSAGLNLTVNSIKNQKNPWEISLYSSTISFASPSYSPTVSLPFTTKQYTFELKVGGEAIGFHPNGYVRGYQSTKRIERADETRNVPVFGYLNLQNAQGNPYALLDFNREKELVYQQKVEFPNIAIPSYTYDLFSITGEGTGGMFRAYRSDIGYVYDASVTTKDGSDQFSGDFGFGPNLVHGGVNIEETHSNTTGGPWVKNNVMAATVSFKQSDSNYQAVYFKNPGEKAINAKEFYKAVGDDDVVTTGLYQTGPNLSTTSTLRHYRNRSYTGSSILTASDAYKAKRDKRTQVITYLNAQEASVAGLDKSIAIYDVNKWGPALCSDSVHYEPRLGGLRKPNHLSEIDVLNADGKRYVYGLPVYNKFQDEVTYAVHADPAGRQTGLTPYYSADDNPDSNINGKDNYYNRERMPAYAHSFLLTGILSADYVDVKGDGITDDDLGDAIKFNYSRLADSDNSFTWRSPYSDNVSYNEGLQTYNRDDKGSYIYGEKELWYMNSIESKNMVAKFILEDRKDLMPITKEGIIGTTTRAKRLAEIRLYSKADLIKNGANAIPIKTVHFKYNNTLCSKSDGENMGKLTLEKIWFTYNGNDKGPKNPYIFKYNSVNPRYDNRSFDRWGTYKDAADNPHSNLTNAEYPYASQDSAKAGSNAAAWTLDSIALPSGGRIKVTYESDDYAYVQNKRAMQLFNVVGLSKVQPTSSHTSGGENDLQNDLYRFQTEVKYSEDKLFIGIRVPKPVSSNNEVYTKYLQNINKLYFKLKVIMPTDEWGSGSEYVPCYADIDAGTTQYYGYLANDPTVIWVKIKGVGLTGKGSGEFSPLAKAAIQFLRMNLPSKAYSRSESTDDIDAGDVIRMVANFIPDIIGAFSSFDREARERKFAIEIVPEYSWVRLNNPDYKKYGGGLRVKSVKVYDNWRDMTDNLQKESIYGQEYDYTTIKNIDGRDRLISSGVASYEPMLGNEENPWRLPVEYIDKTSILSPVTMGYSETPFGESFFPSASVGYSEVTVRSINIKNVKSANGFEKTRFFTTYDFPTIVDNSMLNSDTKKHYNTSLGDFLKMNSKHYLTLSQGFKIELNDMNGKMRSQASYAQTDPLNPISYTENFYKIDDKNADLKHLNNTVKSVNQQGIIDTTAIIGKDIELMTDMRQELSSTVANNYNLDLDAFSIGWLPIPVPSKIPLPQKEENRFQSAATTKIIQRFGILDSVVAIDKGSKISTENLLFDGETGDVVLTRTKNEFNDTIYNLNYPAHWAYSGMGLAYQNINDVFGFGTSGKLSVINGTLQSSTRYPGLKNYFESGDEVLVYGREKASEDTTFDCNGKPTCISNGYSPNFSYSVLWAVDSKQIDSTNAKDFLFLDREGSPYSGLEVSMKIIRSGHRNLASTSLGSIVSLKTPIKKIGSQLKLVIDTTIEVINTSAAIYNERWKVKDALYLKDTTTYELFQTVIYPSTITTKEYAHRKDPDQTIDGLGGNKSNASYVGASYEWVGYDKGGFGSCNTKNIINKSIVQFNFSNIPVQADIQTAYINFSTKNPTTDFCPTIYDDGNHVCHTHNWNDLNNFYAPNSTVSLKRITSSWGPSTNYSSILTTDVNKVSIDYNTYTGVDCKNLIKDVFSNSISKIYGIQFALDNETNDNNDGDDKFRYLTFNGSSNSPYLSLSYTIPDHYTVCRSAVTQCNVNPYVHGILGNWRSDKSFVYYGARAESDPSAPTNIRKNGVIKNFTPFWNFSAAYLTSTTDTVSWVWNSQINLFNRKGFEIENKDPLGRYNAGSYGYNETLPISVTQNSRYQQQFFDGFEDYGYKTENCAVDCALPRPMDFISGGGLLDSTNRHTGIYSLKVDGNTNIGKVAFDLGNLNKEKYALTSKLSFADTTVTGKGGGLIAVVQNSLKGWWGYLQPDVSAFYTIQTTTKALDCSPNSNAYLLELRSVDNPNESVTVTSSPSTNIAELQHQLFAGKLYKISIRPAACDWKFSDTSMTIKWSEQNCTQSNLIPIPAGNLYNSYFNFNAPFPDTTGSLHVSTQSACVRNEGFGADPNVLLPNYNPYAGDTVVVSAWVKEEQTCLCTSFTHNQIIASYKDASGNTISQESLTPSGVIVEGWQRYESIIILPQEAVSVQLQLMATDGYQAYFDDLRLHPYHANMKSFVYDPVSLRLMAELDENNYASFYEYDNDGTLIRVKKETERGVQTIKETRSNLSEK